MKDCDDPICEGNAECVKCSRCFRHCVCCSPTLEHCMFGCAFTGDVIEHFVNDCKGNPDRKHKQTTLEANSL